MASLVLTGDTSGQVTIAAPAVAGTNTITLAAQTGTLNVAGPAFSAYVSANQTVSGSTFVKVPFNTEEFDTNNNYNNTTNYRFTPTVAGYYQFSWMIGFGNSPTRAFTTLYKNGADFKRGSDSSAASNGFGGSALVSMNGSTDYVEVYMYTNNASASNLLGLANISYFQGVLVRGA